MKRLDTSEIIFKILAYVLVTLFALATLYPFIYTISASISSKNAMDAGAVIFWPVEPDFLAIKAFFDEPAQGVRLWRSYTNTLFYTFFGTIFSMGVSIFAGYALSKSKLLFKRQIAFFIIFTMWFSAGLMPTYYNYQALLVTNRWGIIYGFGVQAFNIILLRNYFQGISQEIEEAAIVDGANELQLLTSVYIPMSKSAIATVTLFYALSRWNGYFWNRILVANANEHPLQVILRSIVSESGDSETGFDYPYSLRSLAYAAIVLSVIPIIIIYPYLQKYFARGVNVGGVKE